LLIGIERHHEKVKGGKNFAGNFLGTKMDYKGNFALELRFRKFNSIA
jgi:hypothetical protein